ncbi:unnamed protein product [Alternaria alternata]
MKSPLLFTETHQYTALGPEESSFRILKLLKGSGPELECELSQWSLHEDYPAYEALSYTWGSSELVERITLDQKRFWITDNLYSALQSLRWCHSDRYLWIDAICINQRDPAEQSQQVQQMGQIYEKAKKVLFWLGKATAQIIALMEALDQGWNVSSNCAHKQDMLKNWPWEDHSTGLQQMLNRDWFTRVWILQEAAKAHKADVCCGMQFIPAEMFVLAPILIKQEPPPHCKPVLDIMAESSRSSSWWAQTRDLRTLLRRFQASRATDERDKIYALLGMSSDHLDVKALTIDYRRPTFQVVHETITHLLQPTQTPQSDPFAIHEILNLMTFFATLDVTYFVPALQSTAEVIYPHLQSGHRKSEPYQPEVGSPVIAVVGDPNLFVFEERPFQNLKHQETCYSQIVKLMLDPQLSGALRLRDTYRGMHVFPWGSVDHHIKVVVIHDKRKAMMNAALRGCDQVIRRMLHMKVGVEGEEEFESLLLQTAAAQGEEKALKTLLDAGADVNAQDGENSNALQAAAWRGKEEAVKILLDAGADVNVQGGKYGNALQAAVERGSNKLVKALLDAGADVNAQGGEYGNALQAAAWQGKEEVVKILLDAGADVNARGGEYGNAIQAAVKQGSNKLVKALLDAGVDVNARGGEYGNVLQAAVEQDKGEVIKMLLDAGADINVQGGEYGNALQAAVEQGRDKLVKTLLDVGVHLNVQGGEYSNALQAAVERGSNKLVKALLDAGVDVNAQGGEYGNALQAAVKQGRDKVVKTLLDAGADVNARGGEYGNALQAAAWRGKEEVVKILLDAGADVNAQGGEYGNALQAAVQRDKEKAVKTLLDAGADVNAQGGEYGNALQAAAWRGKEEVVKILLDAGADVNARGGKHGNALQAAIWRGKQEVIKKLLDAGAVVNVQGNNGAASFR